MPIHHGADFVETGFDVPAAGLIAYAGSMSPQGYVNAIVDFEELPTSSSWTSGND